jgi:MFS family permease
LSRSDCTPEKLIGQQLGFAMVGFSIGLVLGPPIGGALYERFGFRGPFIFGVIFSVVDLIGRFVIIERKDSIKWGVDPLLLTTFAEGDAEKDVAPAEGKAEEPKAKPLSFIAVGGKLIKSPRAVSAFVLALLYG